MPNSFTCTVSVLATKGFVGFSGACTGTGPCNVTMDAAKFVTATLVARYGCDLRTLHQLPGELRVHFGCWYGSGADGSTVSG